MVNFGPLFFNLDPKHLVNRLVERHRLKPSELEFSSPQVLQ